MNEQKKEQVSGEKLPGFSLLKERRNKKESPAQADTQKEQKAQKEPKEPKEPKEKKPRSVLQVKGAICLVMAASFALSCAVRTDGAQSKFKLIQAGTSSSMQEKIELYEQSMSLSPNVAACKGLFETYLDAGNTNGVAQYRDVLYYEFDETDWVNKKLADYTPQAPVPSLEEGVFAEDFDVTFNIDRSLAAHSKFNPVMHIEVTPDAHINQNTVFFLSNGTYTVEAYTSNDLGMRSPTVSYTYELEKLIPNPVTWTLPSGYYRQPVTVELVQDQNLPIYYTLDGSAVTTDATLYTGPITLEKGTLDIRAAGYSDVGSGTFGEESTCYYHIPPFTSGTERGNILLSGRGLVVASTRSIRLYENGEVTREWSAVDDVDALCEYNNGLLYSSGKAMYLMDIHTGESAEFAELPFSIEYMIRFDQYIYALDNNGNLRRMDENGAWTQFTADIDVRYFCISEDGTTLFFASGNTLSALNTETLEITQLYVEEGENIYHPTFCNGKLYFVTSRGDAKVYNPSDATTTLLLEYTEEVNSKSSYGFSDGYRNTSSVEYTDVFSANHRVFIMKRDRTQHTVITWSPFKDNETSSSSDYEWLIYNPATDTYEGTINTKYYPVFGDGYYVSNGDVVPQV